MILVFASNPDFSEQTLKDTDPSHDGISTENAILNEIKCDLRQSLPLEAVASSEQIVYPNTGEVSVVMCSNASHFTYKINNF